MVFPIEREPTPLPPSIKGGGGIFESHDSAVKIDPVLPMAGVWLETVDSTQEEAKRRLAHGEIQQDFVIIAEAQTAGHGTHGRYWASEAGAGLYFSLVLMPENPAVGFPVREDYPLLAARACQKALHDLTALPITVKPINDLMIEGKKTRRRLGR